MYCIAEDHSFRKTILIWARRSVAAYEGVAWLRVEDNFPVAGRAIYSRSGN
jgi:hypothetical protein